MSHQERTWTEYLVEESGARRWDVSINGTPVEGGYIQELEDGTFECHYPHIQTFVKDTLEEAKRRLEWAPPITGGGKIRIVAEDEEEMDDGDELLDAEQAGFVLGVSRFRVNAMVANGKLAARRAADGSYRVRRSAVEKLLES